MNLYRCYFIGFWTLCYKEFLRFLRIWPQTLLPPLVTMSLYFIIFGTLVGAQIRPIGGYPYAQYIAPGLVLMSVIINAYNNTVSSFFISRFTRNIEEILISPMPNTLIILGYTFGGVCRGLLTGCCVGSAALYFAHIHVHHIALSLTILVLVSAVFALAGLSNALFAKNFDDISIIPTFVLTPLTYLAGIFYSVDQLPTFWHHLALLDPILYMVRVFRYSLLGFTDNNLGLGLSIILIVAISFFYLNLWLLKRGTGLKS